MIGGPGRGRSLEPLAVAGAGGLAVCVGAAAAVSPPLGAALALSVVPLALLSLGARLVGLYLGAVAVLLVGYAFFGRGFAYFGVPPLYVGDAVLGLGLLALVAARGRLRMGPLHWPLFAFMAWGAARTLPFIERDGVNALRDGVVWGYGFFAVALAALLEPRHFAVFVGLFRRAVKPFLLWVPVIAIATLVAYGALPRWPGSGQPIAVFKGDMGVHLAAVAAFLLLGLYAPRRRGASARELLVWPLWFAGVAIVATQTRGGMLAVGAGVIVALLLRASTTRRFAFLAVSAGLVTAVALADPQIDIGRTDKLSLRQLQLNLESVVGESQEGTALRANRDFRLGWWQDIWDYTVHGPYFWKGKGFGVNLADDDGYQSDGTLRAPHNTHMTVLARTGVPGFAIWVVFHLAFAAMLLAAFRRASRRGAVFWAQVNGVLLVYWAAMMVETSFDPYLEGPQGGIWYWCVVGLGLAALRIQRESLDEPEGATG